MPGSSAGDRPTTHPLISWSTSLHPYCTFSSELCGRDLSETAATEWLGTMSGNSIYDHDPPRRYRKASPIQNRIHSNFDIVGYARSFGDDGVAQQNVSSHTGSGQNYR